MESNRLNERIIDWQKCSLCQSVTSESLLDPMKSKAMKPEQCYGVLENIILEFERTSGSTPVKVDVALLDEGCGIKTTLLQHNAKWHKSCRLKLNAKAMKTHLNKCDPEPELVTTSEDAQVTTSSTRCLREKQTTSGHIAICFFCDGEETADHKFHLVLTLGLDAKVRECATKLGDQKLLAKLNKGDMVAQDATYHKLCLVKLYNKCRRVQPSDEEPEEHGKVEAMVLAELITYIESARGDTNSPVFKMTDLVNMYTERLNQMGIDVQGRIHSTKLKDRILTQINDLRSFRKGRDSYLVFDSELEDVIQKAYQHKLDDEANILSKAAAIVRKEIKQSNVSFPYKFEEGSQQHAVPSSLMSIVSMILYGCNIKKRSCSNSQTQPALTISQLLLFNCKSERSNPNVMYHQRIREPPIAVGLGLYIHTHTRQRQILDLMFTLGLCVSYDRVLEISNCIAETLCNKYEQDNLVCPPNLLKGIFTTAAGDNIDHNPSATTAHTSFHGTGISLFQHPPPKHSGETWATLEYPSKAISKSVPYLPDFYTTVSPVTQLRPNVTLPSVHGPYIGNLSALREAEAREYDWLSHVKDYLDSNTDADDRWLSWSAYHANSIANQEFSPSIGALLPLLKEPSHTPAMIAHAFLKAIGCWLEGSGWTQVLVDAQVASAGTAESFLTAGHIMRTRKAHQVTICALNSLLQTAFRDANTAVDENFQKWCEQRQKESALFQYWYITLSLELLLNMYVQSLRTGNFRLYCDCLTKMCPWFFALDRINYARWLPIHLRDMVNLEHTHPDIAANFVDGSFVVHKTNNHFSALPIDQAHEQHNAIIKGEGGAVGLTENPSALRRWTVAGPEVARIVVQFENMIDSSTSENTRHHDENQATQRLFEQQVKRVIFAFMELGNPFCDDTGDLMNIVTKQSVHENVKQTVMTIEEVGSHEFRQYVDKRIDRRVEPISQPIKKLKMPLFSTPPPRSSKSKSVLRSVRNDCNLFARLYIGCETRGGDLNEFFRHENHAWPPSLAEYGQIRIAKKSDIIGCVEQLLQDHDAPETLDVVLIDGAVVVHLIRPTEAMKTFEDYAEKGILPYLKSQFRRTTRLEIIWDTYLPGSLKASARKKRGTGIRTRVLSKTPLPKKWHEFLRMDENKEELFHFLSSHLRNISPDVGTVVTTIGEDTISNVDICLESVTPCSHEEADTRLMLHAHAAIQQGCSRILIRTVDSDVMVLGIALAAQYINANIKLWIELGTGKNIRVISAHGVASAMGLERASALPAFHALSGCDTVSAFATRGKKSAWKAWEKCPEMTHALIAISRPCKDIDSDIFDILQQFVVIMYDHTCSETDVNAARRYLFTQKHRTLDGIPPTKDALMLHVKRAAYQAGHVWGQANVKKPVLPSPGAWGWTRDDIGWEPTWTTIPEALKSCIEIMACACHQQKCSGHCKCVKYHVQCTSLSNGVVVISESDIYQKSQDEVQLLLVVPVIICIVPFGEIEFVRGILCCRRQLY
ncbi:unnamed protein product [Phaedon cochleariae]|uniref:Uncharacterized protein n=1 Tax=Phaedon cochleariae TaxID=80249 RepID=A0A9P0DJW4_PHACE|nr:unnamed protein product [Phaedon cochleariae]